MDEREWLAERFQADRVRLRAAAYRMLGSLSEADDAVQEAWLRFNRCDRRGIENPRGWFTTVVARVCLDVLRRRKSRREAHLGPHVPDPIVSLSDRVDPEQEALLADSIGLALLVVLETLGPAERVAFVLHDVFGLPFDEIAPIVERSVIATKQLASRARRRVRAAPGPSREVRGARSVAEQALTFSRLAWRVRPVLVNGAAGAVSWLPGGRLLAVLGFTVRQGRIVVVDVLSDPTRLRHLDLGSPTAEGPTTEGAS